MIAPVRSVFHALSKYLIYSIASVLPAHLYGSYTGVAFRYSCVYAWAAQILEIAAAARQCCHDPARLDHELLIVLKGQFVVEKRVREIGWLEQVGHAHLGNHRRQNYNIGSFVFTRTMFQTEKNKDQFHWFECPVALQCLKLVYDDPKMMYIMASRLAEYYMVHNFTRPSGRKAFVQLFL